MTKRMTILSLSAALLACSWGSASAQPLPKFFGVYIVQGGKYVEVPCHQFDKEEYNHRNTPMGKDFNVRLVLNHSQFMPVDSERFNQDGFVVVQAPDWATATLWHVPSEGKYRENENQARVTIMVVQSGPGGMPFSSQGLDVPIKSSVVPTKQGRAGEGAFMFVPERPVNKGLYFVDFKKGDKYSGMCAIEVKE